LSQNNFPLTLVFDKPVFISHSTPTQGSLCVVISLPTLPAQQPPVAPQHAFPVSNVLGLPIACVTYQDVLNFLDLQLAARSKTFCVTLNLDILRLTAEKPDFHAVVKAADFVFADGMPILWLSQLNKSNPTMPERVAGCDIAHDLCRMSHQKGYRVFILGAAPGVADLAVEKLRAELPNLQMAGTYSPAFSELQDAVQSQQIIDRINAAGTDILLVALGAPKQEMWIAKNLSQLDVAVILPCGGSIDFIAGVQKKSPRWIGKLGLEWVFRMACSPKRLFDRYIVHDLPFLVRACMQTLRA
jgi:N-acetylglucosaminyldiphosphoundecaprenol N-acetyl-beta-D-mannosaminyltransferase